MPRLLLLVLAASACLAFAPTRTPDEDEARAFALEWVAAYNAHDGAALAALYADGAIVVWPGGYGTVVDDSFEAGAVAWHSAHPEDRLDLTSANVRLVGRDGAVVQLEGSGRLGPEGTVVRGNVLLVLERAGAGWHVAGEHWMVIEAD